MHGKVLHGSEGPITVKLAIPPAVKNSNNTGLPVAPAFTTSVRYNPMAKPAVYGYTSNESSVAAAITQQQQQQQQGRFLHPIPQSVLVRAQH